ncbi:hypothetical protein MAR_001879 [Mya arenaria]|uniref:B box-type domain-containing protein n=1 Tax=Mya arenaria TaxID=6604 RepID=A0ABY7FGF7_MYAAR|nr:hypothetical protein MAR_001879 [Mya arenaria]
MATGFSASVLHAGDFEYDYPCTECQEHGLNSEAIYFCQQCTRQFCGVCIKQHDRFYRKHPILGTEKRDLWGKVKSTCKLHPGEEMKVFCNDHGQSCCITCQKELHRQCKQVILLQNKTPKPPTRPVSEKSGNSTVTTNSDQLFFKRTEKVGTSEHDKLPLKSTEKVGTSEHDTLPLKSTEKVGTSEHDKLPLNLKEKVGKREHDKLPLKLKEKVGTSELDKLQLKSKEKDGTSEHDKLPLKSKEQVGTSEHDKPQVVSDVDPYRQYKVIETKRLKVKLENGDDPCRILGITVLPEGDIILIDNWNRKVKLLSADYAVVDYITISLGPLGICAVSGNQVAVCFGNKDILFFNVKNSKLKMERKLQLDFGCSYMAYMAGNLYVASGKTVYQLTLAGQRVRTIYTIDGRYVRGLAVSPDGDRLYITVIEDHQLFTALLFRQTLFAVIECVADSNVILHDQNTMIVI